MLRSIASVGALTLVSRLLGFVRDVLNAVYLGAGPVADAFLVAFRLPNHFRALLAEGAFNAAFVPTFSQRLVADGAGAARRFAEQVLSWMVAAQLVLLIAIEAIMPWFMRGFAPGFDSDPAKFELAVLFTRITFPYLLLISLVALLGALLNSVGRFTAAAAAPILLNVCLIGAQFVLAPIVPTVGHALAWGVAAAGVAQFLYLARDAARAGWPLRLRRPRVTPEIRQFLRVFGTAALGAGLTQINLFLDTLIASLLPSGVSYLYYADRLNQLPLGVIGIAIGTVLLPEMTQALKRGEDARAIERQNRALEWSLVATVPAAAAFVIAAEPIVAALFQWRAFSAADAHATARTLTMYAVGLPAFVAVKAVLPGFYARGDMRTPVRVAAVAVAVNVALKLALMGPLAQAGLALATSVSAWVNFVLLAVILLRRGWFVADPALTRALPRLAIAGAALAAALVAAQAALGPATGDARIVVRLGALASLLGCGGAAFVLVAWALDLAGMRAALRRTASRLGARRRRA